MNRLILVRGLPGSGKSTYSKALDGFYHVEADMYHVTTKGEYIWKPANVHKAHTWCQRQAALALERGENVVVSNTFVKLWELEPYIKMAETLNIPYEIVTMLGQYESIHNVPAQAIYRMRQNWEAYVS